MRATRAIIHLDNFRRNIAAARKKAGPHPRLCVPVKADAYGHGAVPIARAALETGVEYLAVATVSEGAELRKAGIKAGIILLSQALPEEMGEISDLNLISLVSDLESIEVLAANTRLRPLEIHLKVDTGMGRMGCRPEKALELAIAIDKSRKLKLGGIATHLSVADSRRLDDITYTKTQIALFKEAVDSIKKAGINPGRLHAANSGALCFHEETYNEDAYFNLVRPGIFLYGYSSDGYLSDIPALPVMELRSTVVFIKKIYPGEEISYGRSWKAQEETYIGTLPIGYADGLPRLLSNRHSVHIRGKVYPIVGRICMDQCMVDLGNTGEPQRWDEAVIFGPGFETAQTMAEKIGTISYEILCNINKRVPRLYVN